MDKHKKGYFSLLLEEYRVTEGWVYWLMMELANGFQERTRVPWWDNIAWVHCMLNGVHKKEQMYCKIVKRVILCSQQLIHTVIVLHCVEYILIHKPVYRWNDLLWRIILHNPGFRYVFIIFFFSVSNLCHSNLYLLERQILCKQCISLFKKRLSFFYKFAQLKYITGWWISINHNLYIYPHSLWELLPRIICMHIVSHLLFFSTSSTQDLFYNLFAVEMAIWQLAEII